MNATAPETNISAEKLQAILAILFGGEEDGTDDDEARRQAAAIAEMPDDEVAALAQQGPQQHARGDFLSALMYEDRHAPAGNGGAVAFKKDSTGHEHDSKGLFTAGGGGKGSTASKGQSGAQAKKKAKRRAAEQEGKPAEEQAKRSAVAEWFSKAAAPVKETAARLGQAAWSKLSPNAQARAAKVFGAAKAIEHALMTGFRKAKQVAIEAARERGLSEEHTERVGRVLAVTDNALAWSFASFGIATALTGSLTAGKVASYLPVASLAYIAGSTARNPLAVARAARKVFAKGYAAGHAAAAPAQFARHPAGGSLAETLLHLFDGATDPDWCEALLMAALDETQDVNDAIALVKRALAENATPPIEDDDEEEEDEWDDLADDDDGAHATAEFYASLFWSLTDAGSPPSDEQVDEANAELEESGWSVVQDERGRWHVEEMEEAGEGVPEAGPRQHKRVKKGTPGAIELKDKNNRAYYVDKLTEKKLPALHPESVEKRRARGSVDKEKVRERMKAALEKHQGDVELSDYGKQRTNLSLRMLKRHHGELAAHRIDELAEQVEAALERIPEDTPRNRKRKEDLRLQLARLHHMVGELDREPEPKPEKVKRNSLPANPIPGAVFNVQTGDLKVDPQRFQYKISGIGAGGVTQELKEVREWNPDFAGVVSVWKDPGNGETYVVNGHHRHELANRLGAKNLAVRYVEARDAKEARALGALINIAEGRGTAIDAAKFMRDAGKGPEDMEAKGISLKGKVAADAATLTRLSDKQFDRLARGQLDESRALAVARHLPDHDKQDALFRLLDKREEEGKDLTNRVVEEMAKEMAATPTTTTTEKTLFGDIESEESLFVPRNELKSYIRTELAREINDFLAGASKRRAERLGQHGNVLDIETNRKIAEQAEAAKYTYDTLVNSKGPISDALNTAAAGYVAAKTRSQRDAVKQTALTAVRDAILAEDRGAAVGGAVGPADSGGAKAGAAEPGAGAPPVPEDEGGGGAEPAGLTPTPEVQSALERARNPVKTAQKSGGLFGGGFDREQEAFQALPEGTEFAFTNPDSPHYGQTGKIVHTPDSRIVATIAGHEDEGHFPIDPSSIEPLKASQSWRTEAGAVGGKTGSLFSPEAAPATVEKSAEEKDHDRISGQVASVAATGKTGKVDGHDVQMKPGYPGTYQATIGGKKHEGDARYIASRIQEAASKSTSPGFTGIDASGHEWVMGEMVTRDRGPAAGPAAPKGGKTVLVDGEPYMQQGGEWVNVGKPEYRASEGTMKRWREVPGKEQEPAPPASSAEDTAILNMGFSPDELATLKRDVANSGADLATAARAALAAARLEARPMNNEAITTGAYVAEPGFVPTTERHRRIMEKAGIKVPEKKEEENDEEATPPNKPATSSPIHTVILDTIRKRGIAQMHELESAAGTEDIKPALEELVREGKIVPVGGRQGKWSSARPQYKLAEQHTRHDMALRFQRLSDRALACGDRASHLIYRRQMEECSA